MVFLTHFLFFEEVTSDFLKINNARAGLPICIKRKVEFRMNRENELGKVESQSDSKFGSEYHRHTGFPNLDTNQLLEISRTLNIEVEKVIIAIFGYVVARFTHKLDSSLLVFRGSDELLDLSKLEIGLLTAQLSDDATLLDVVDWMEERGRPTRIVGNSETPHEQSTSELGTGSADMMSGLGFFYNLGEPANNSKFESIAAGANLTVAVDLTVSAGNIAIEFYRSRGLIRSGTLNQIMIAVLRLIGSLSLDPNLLLRDWFCSPADGPACTIRESQAFAYFDEEENVVSRFKSFSASEALAATFGSETVSHHELDALAMVLAESLLEMGVKKGDIVGVYLDRCLELPIAILGILRIGAIYLPIERELPFDRVEWMLEDSGCNVIVAVSGDRIPVFDKCKVLYTCSDQLRVKKRSFPKIDSKINGFDIAYMLYTSGSTGVPKGVLISHAALINYLEWVRIAFGIGFQDNILHKTPIGFDVSVHELLLPFVSGAHLVISPIGAHREPLILKKLLVSHEITMTCFVPSMLNAFISSFGVSENLKLRWLLSSGEPLSSKTVADFHSHIEGKLINLYGPTEVTIHATVWECGGKESTVPIGRALPTVHFLILDEHMQEVEPGRAGELYLGGIQVSNGYLNRSDKTETSFVISPNFASEIIYRTGDFVKERDGVLEYLGRSDDQVKIAGVRIELAELEVALQSIDCVADCAVLVIDGPDNVKELAAFVVSHQSNAKNILRVELAAKLPSYALPQFILHVDDIPRTANGKRDKRVLKGLLSATTRRKSLSGGNRIDVATEIWCEALGVPKADPANDFFAFGGSSLVAAKIVALLYKELRIEISTNHLLSNPSFAAYIRKVEESSSLEKNQPFRKVEKHETFPLNSAQRLIWIHQNLFPNEVMYNENFLISMNERVQFNSVQSATNELIDSYPLLSVNFRDTSQGIVQFFRKSHGCKVHEFDLSQSAEAESSLGKIGNDFVRKPFDTETDQLFRVAYFAMANNQTKILITAHHLIIDGWSIYRCVIPFFRNAIEKAEKIGVDDRNLPTMQNEYLSYRDHKFLHLTESISPQQQAYWRRNIEAFPSLKLESRSNGANAVSGCRGAHVAFEIPRDQVDRIRMLVQREELTMYNFYLTAFCYVLQELIGGQTITVASASSGRSDSDFYDLVGNTMNTILVGADFSEDQNFFETVRSTQERTLSVLKNEVAFEKIIPLMKSLNSSQTPYDVMFVIEPQEEQNGSSWHVDQTYFHPGAVKTKLTMELDEKEDGVLGRIEYNDDFFIRSDISDILSRFLEILNTVRAETKVSDLVDQTFVSNQPCTDTIERVTEQRSSKFLLPDYVDRFAKETPDRIAIRHGSVVETYSELSVSITTLADRFTKMGLKPGGIVAVMLPRGLPLVHSILALMKLDVVYVPIDAKTPIERVEYLVRNSEAIALLVSGLNYFQVSDVGVKVWNVEDLAESESGNHAPSEAWNSSEFQPDGQRLAYIMYTSGSSGKPKGVCITQHSLMKYLEFASKEYFAGPVTGGVVATSIGFDATITSLFAPLMVGKEIVLLQEETQMQDLITLLRSAKKSYLFKLTPTHLKLADSIILEDKSLNSGAISKERHVLVVGGEQLSCHIANRWVKELLPRATIINEYGPTETTVGCCVYSMAAGNRLTDSVVPIGRPIEGVTFSVLGENATLVNEGDVGELTIGGWGVAKGYVNDDARTKKVFAEGKIGDPAEQECYKTGDLVRLRSDGNYEFIGRCDDQLKIDGHRVELAEVEFCILQCRGVANCVAVLFDSSDAKEIVAAVLISTGFDEVDVLDAVHMLAKRSLPDYMRPSKTVVLSEVPINQNGKADREEIIRIIASLTPNEVGVTFSENTFLQFASSLMEAGHKLSLSDHFFESGGSSLAAIRFARWLQAEGFEHVKPSTIYRFPVTGELFKHITSQD